jgi:hypothetical protein
MTSAPKPRSTQAHLAGNVNTTPAVPQCAAGIFSKPLCIEFEEGVHRPLILLSIPERAQLPAPEPEPDFEDICMDCNHPFERCAC